MTSSIEDRLGDNIFCPRTGTLTLRTESIEANNAIESILTGLEKLSLVDASGAQHFMYALSMLGCTVVITSTKWGRNGPVTWDAVATLPEGHEDDRVTIAPMEDSHGNMKIHVTRIKDSPVNPLCETQPKETA